MEENQMKRTRLLALLAVLAMVVAACGGGDGEEEATTTTAGDGGAEATTTTAGETTEPTDAPSGGNAGEGGELLILQWQAPSQANGLLSSGTKDFLASSLVLEPLAEIAPNGEVVATGLAAEVPTVENGGIAEDFSSITWTLKEDVLWSDGTPFTADDVLFTWEYCSDELTGCAADISKIESVDVVDDLTVTFNFTEPQPYPYGAGFVSYGSVVIQRAQFQDCVGEGASACTEQNFAPIGTGPYMVTDLRPEDTVTYEMNPNYRGIPDGKPFFGSVTIKGGGDAEASARSVLEIGEADYAWNLQVAPEILQPMEAAGNGTIVTSFTANVEHINLNQTDPDGDPPSEFPSQHPVLYQNGELARALSLAIDRDALVAVGYGPTGVPTCTIWPVGDQATTNNDWCLTRDVATANQILDDAGYVDTDGDGVRETPDGTPLEFDYVTSTNAVRQSNQDIVKANWEEIGVVANMSNQDASLFFDGTSASDFSIWKFFTDIQMYTNGATYPDAAGYMHGYHTDEITTAALGWPANNNIVRFSDPTYDEIADRALTLSPTDPEYVDLVKQMQEIIVDQGAVIPLIHRGNVSGISNTIEGFGEPNGWDSEYWNIEEWTRSG
jgi:peptide/nickel transport system substrate-binding protein